MYYSAAAPADGSPALPAPKQKKAQTPAAKQAKTTESDSKSPKAQLFQKATPKKTHAQVSPRVTRSAAKRKATK